MPAGRVSNSGEVSRTIFLPSGRAGGKVNDGALALPFCARAGEAVRARRARGQVRRASMASLRDGATGGGAVADSITEASAAGIASEGGGPVEIGTQKRVRALRCSW